MNWFKIRYNKKSAKKYGWTPSWFGSKEFDNDLIENIKEFQRLHDLKADGLCGPATHRRAYTNKLVYIDDREDAIMTENKKNRIFCNGIPVSIKWDKIEISWINSKCYSKVKGKTRKPTMVVTHWDATLSAASCKRILEKRKISTHFVIDNDGTIVQLVDPQDVAWHAGIRRVNKASVGIDFSNAVYTKYNKAYSKKGFGLRPVIDGWRVHGWRPKPFLGAYPVQVEAYKALLEALNRHYDIPLECPLDEDGELLTRVHKPSVRAKFKGVVNHYNLSKKKWDTLGLELDKILEEIRLNKD
tara:strand:+ start:1527 stop:2426 length:900 start_codon:yes stop_codon:yes gene_type:complete